jgi:ZIP family zinc transporter
MLEAGLWSAAAAASLVLGAAIALTARPARSRVGQAMAFGAGALLAALAYELLPGSSADELWIWIWFGAGALVFYAGDLALERRTGTGAGEAMAGQTIALGALLDGVPESIVLGMSLAVGGEVSVGFLVAVFVSNLPESLAATAELRAGRSTRSIYGLWTSIAVVSGVAGALGYLLADTVGSIDGRYVQAFAGGAVLTMLADSMVPEAYAYGRKPVALLTALGFAIAAVLSTLD